MWKPALGTGIADHVIVPDPVSTNTLTFEVEPIQIIALPAGEAGPVKWVLFGASWWTLA